VKVEDLVIVYRWLERHCVPQSYCQVFFDSVFAVNFLDIFSTIGSGRSFTIETPEKSQEKATIMIPITSGTQIGRATAIPTFAAKSLSVNNNCLPAAISVKFRSQDATNKILGNLR
jgi:hypothetical protein